MEVHPILKSAVPAKAGTRKACALSKDRSGMGPDAISAFARAFVASRCAETMVSNCFADRESR
jgi:hypothetical protein